jgi:pimeloyl-ACP methyl ester carboxylesterase
MDSTKPTQSDRKGYPMELPTGIRSQVIENINGLTMHLLEAGDRNHPMVLLLHGFPELAWSWRNVMPALADAGYHVIAPDQRGYGRTLGWDADFDGDVASFRPLNLVLDALCLIKALGRQSVHAVVGHDFGSPVAAWCALTRPDVFSRVALMSAPFAGPPAFPAGPNLANTLAPRDMHTALAALDPPRKHYQHYYSSRQANVDLLEAPQGLSRFLRAYYHAKSADFSGNRPHPLATGTAEALAQLPTYYLMNEAESMAETVAVNAPDDDAAAGCRWLTDQDLSVYVNEFARTGFQGGLNWYRAVAMSRTEQALFAGKRIEQPSLFIAGSSDWGIYQTPGSFERMQSKALGDLQAARIISGAGHWVQQEQPAAVVELLSEFFNTS